MCIRDSINPPIDTEYNSLKKLSKKLKQYCTFIQTLGEHEWDLSLIHIYKVPTVLPKLYVQNCGRLTGKKVLYQRYPVYNPSVHQSDG